MNCVATEPLRKAHQVETPLNGIKPQSTNAEVANQPFSFFSTFVLFCFFFQVKGHPIVQTHLPTTTRRFEKHLDKPPHSSRGKKPSHFTPNKILLHTPFSVDMVCEVICCFSHFLVFFFLFHFVAVHCSLSPMSLRSHLPARSVL